MTRKPRNLNMRTRASRNEVFFSQFLYMLHSRSLSAHKFVDLFLLPTIGTLQSALARIASNLANAVGTSWSINFNNFDQPAHTDKANTLGDLFCKWWNPMSVQSVAQSEPLGGGADFLTCILWMWLLMPSCRSSLSDAVISTASKEAKM